MQLKNLQGKSYLKRTLTVGTMEVLLIVKTVELTRRAKRDLKKVPRFIVDKLLAWVARVEKVGIEEVRKIPGYHDEPLRGKRVGQRSIRLNKAYRAIYIVKNDRQIEFISIEEVNKHDY